MREWFESHSLRHTYSEGLRAYFLAATTPGYRDIQEISLTTVLATELMPMKVAIYIRESGSRQYKPGRPCGIFTQYQFLPALQPGR
jgi:hypothetical protein